MDVFGIDVFGESDLVALASVADRDLEELRDELRRRPWHLHDLLTDPELVDAVTNGDIFSVASTTPMLFFAVLVHQVADEVTSAEWIADWSGPKTRLPVFDVEPLVTFAQRPVRLLYLTRLLVSFTHPNAASLPLPVPIDALDLDELVAWVQAVEPGDRPAILRRLGDVALFLAGVCADRTGPQVLSALEAERFGLTLGLDADAILSLVDPGSLSPGIDTLEALGTRWYAAAAMSPGCSLPAMSLDFSRHMTSARRFLNVLADRYLNSGVVELGLTS